MVWSSKNLDELLRQLVLHRVTHNNWLVTAIKLSLSSSSVSYVYICIVCVRLYCDDLTLSLLANAVQVAFRTTDMKPLAILSLKVELQPHTVSQTFRFNHPEHSIMKKSIRVPPLHSLAGNHGSSFAYFKLLFIAHQQAVLCWVNESNTVISFYWPT